MLALDGVVWRLFVDQRTHVEHAGDHLGLRVRQVNNTFRPTSAVDCELHYPLSARHRGATYTSGAPCRRHEMASVPTCWMHWTLPSAWMRVRHAGLDAAGHDLDMPRAIAGLDELDSRVWAQLPCSSRCTRIRSPSLPPFSGLCESRCSWDPCAHGPHLQPTASAPDPGALRLLSAGSLERSPTRRDLRSTCCSSCPAATRGNSAGQRHPPGCAPLCAHVLGVTSKMLQRARHDRPDARHDLRLAPGLSTYLRRIARSLIIEAAPLFASRPWIR